MNKVLVLSLILSLFCAAGCKSGKNKARSDKENTVHHLSPDTSRQLNTIAFGSCSRQYYPQPIWSQIASHNPDLWIWLGDIIYSDTEDMEQKKNDYAEAKDKPGYRDFISRVPVVAVWDDHDFGANDAGSEYPKKRESRNLLYDFLDIGPDDELRKRDGAYQAYNFGSGSGSVKIILLDCRFFRDPIKKKAGIYQPNPDGDILGEDQWEWFEEELKNNQSTVTIIGNGIQVIPEDHKYEKWSNLPKSRERLFNLLSKYYRPNMLLISGDRHIAELSEYLLNNNKKIYELTSSGLTHSFHSLQHEPNRWRISELIKSKNFALIKINWDNPDELIKLEVRGENNELLIEKLLNYNS